jgi:hypothetical protein
MQNIQNIHDLEPETLRQSRENLITKMLGSHDDVKYLQQLTRDELNVLVNGNRHLFDCHLTGNEVCVEYHLFELDGNIPVVQQLRMTTSPEIKRLREELKQFFSTARL